MIKNLIILFAFNRALIRAITVFHRFYCQLRHSCATEKHVYLVTIIYIVFDNNANLKKGKTLVLIHLKKN